MIFIYEFLPIRVKILNYYIKIWTIYTINKIQKDKFDTLWSYL